MRLRPAAVVGAGVGIAGVTALAVHSAPSLVALSWLGRHVSPGLAGVGIPGHVALTFDDGPDPASTPAFLDALDALGWHATFFMLGDMARRAPGLAAEVASAGHEVAVHGDQHRSQLRLSPRVVADDILRARDAVASATGVEPMWFRPPYGTLSLGGVRGARRAGLRTVLWTAWGRDWRAEATPQSVVGDVLEGSVDGGTVLLHDSDCTSAPQCWHATLGALPSLAAELDARSLRVGPVGEHGIPRPDRAAAWLAVAYLFALGAGLCYAIASVFQHRVAAAAPKDLSLSPRLLLVVVRHPMWLFGIGLDVGAYFLEALALANGSIVLVQTLMVSGLLFALPLSTIGHEHRPGRKEWFAAAAVAGGIAVFLAVGDPSDGHGRATPLDWVIAFSVCGAIILAMILATRKAPPNYRALGLAVATGASYALTAALTKQVVTIIDRHGVEGLFTHWPVYALAVFSIVGLILNQSAFNAGALAASLPALAVTNPVLSSILGVALFEETLSAHGLLQYTVSALAVVVMIGGVIRLARSPFVTGEEDGGHPPLTPASP